MTDERAMSDFAATPQIWAERKTLILENVRDLSAALLYYDRKENEYLPVGLIEAAIAAGAVTVDDIVQAFREQLLEDLKP